MEPIVQTKKPALLVTSVTLLFSYIFVIFGIVANYFNSQDVFIAFVFESAIIFAFIIVKGYISFWYQSINILESNQLPIKISYLRIFIFSIFLLCVYSLFFFGFLAAEWAVIKAIYDVEFSVLTELIHLKSLILIMLGHHVFSFVFNFIKNKEYISYFRSKNSLLIFKLAFNRIFVMQCIIFLFIPIMLLGFTSNFLLIPFVLLRYFYDLKAHRESHARTT